MKKTIAILMILVGIAFTFQGIIGSITHHYEYQREVQSYWDIADRTSTYDFN